MLRHSHSIICDRRTTFILFIALFRPYKVLSHTDKNNKIYHYYSTKKNIAPNRSDALSAYLKGRFIK